MNRTSDQIASFLSWKYQGVAFIAARNGDGYGIADAAGNYYGAWQAVENFRRLQRTGDSGAKPIGTICSISVRST